MTIHRRRIYIIPSRFGATLALLLIAMLIAGLNYNSNLGLAFGFLMSSLALVAMHHCHRNLLGLSVDTATDIDAFAGGHAHVKFVLRNDSAVERRDIEVLCGGATVAAQVAAGGYVAVAVSLPAARRGLSRVERCELRTRYPFGWFRAWTYLQAPLTLYVAPAPGAVHAPPALAAAAGSAAAAESRGDEEFAGLRAYEAGVPLKHMAWKVLARGGEAAVRSYSGPAAQPEWFEWSALEPLGTEARLAQLCRWVLDGETARRPYGLRIPGTEIPPAQGAAHRTACLRALAGYPA